MKTTALRLWSAWSLTATSHAWLSSSSSSSSSPFRLASLRLPTARATSTSNLDTDATTKFVPPARVVRDVLPTVYVYDHCPFCVRVRFALGVKNVKHHVHFLANDDVPTPTALVGKKIAPVWVWPEADIVMAESLDICRLVDADERFGPVQAIRPATERTDIRDWQKSVQSLLRTLQRPRYVATGLLPEFQQRDARDAFVANHQLPPYEKNEWKGSDGPTLAEKWQLYRDARDADPTQHLQALNEKLVELDELLDSEYHCSPGGLSYDDVDLFARLRSVTIVKGVQWPTKLRAYMDYMAELGDVPLYDAMAM
jgi:glutaredoxin 2